MEVRPAMQLRPPRSFFDLQIQKKETHITVNVYILMYKHVCIQINITNDIDDT